MQIATYSYLLDSHFQFANPLAKKQQINENKMANH